MNPCLAQTAGLEPANANPDRMADESRLERRLDRAVARATTPRGATIVIATASTVITVGAGLLMTLVDGENFPSIGSGLWWAVQTVTTVGYGDDVPTNLTGRLVAVLVMLLGIAFLTVITASITSTFVSRSRRERRPGCRDCDGGASPSTRQPARTNRSRTEPFLVAVAVPARATPHVLLRTSPAEHLPGDGNGGRSGRWNTATV